LWISGVHRSGYPGVAVDQFGDRGQLTVEQALTQGQGLAEKVAAKYQGK